MEQQKIAKIKQELKANYKFIKYDGLILETFATNLLKLHSNDVSKTIEYLETLSKKDITDKFICIVKDFETSNEISEIIKFSIQIENEKLASYPIPAKRRGNACIDSRCIHRGRERREKNGERVFYNRTIKQ